MKFKTDRLSRNSASPCCAKNVDANINSAKFLAYFYVFSPLRLNFTPYSVNYAGIGVEIGC